MQERFNLYGSFEENESSPGPKCQSPTGKYKANIFANDLERI